MPQGWKNVRLCDRGYRSNRPGGVQGIHQSRPATLDPYGGRYIARGGTNETLEGNWQAKRLVILEFPSAEKAKAWLHSPEYAPARALHHKYAQTNMVLVEDVG